MTPAKYRAEWGLSPDYPVVCPAYARTRSALARYLGLKAAQAMSAPEPAAAPEPKAAAPTPKRARAKMNHPGFFGADWLGIYAAIGVASRAA